MEDVGRRAGLRHDDEVRRGVLAVRRADECLEPGEVRVDLPKREGDLDDGDTSHVKVSSLHGEPVAAADGTPPGPTLSPTYQSSLPILKGCRWPLYD